MRYYLTLTPRQLPSNALYDALGSALFDAICELPWYPVTRAERRLIAAHRADIMAAAGAPQRLIELGGGNGEKLRLLLGDPGDEVTGSVRRVDLVDVSPSALASASRLVSEDRDLRVVTHTSRYEDGLVRATATRGRSERCAVLFLGSNIGNFDPPAACAFLATVHAALEAGDCLIIGADLVKPPEVLHAAYDDPLGVTAAFNKNLLLHLNRDLGATFDINSFEHRAVWNPDEHAGGDAPGEQARPTRGRAGVGPVDRARRGRDDLDGKFLQVFGGAVHVAAHQRRFHCPPSLRGRRGAVSPRRRLRELARRGQWPVVSFQFKGGLADVTEKSHPTRPCHTRDEERGMKDDKAVELVIGSDKLAFLEQIAKKYELPDVGKAVRILIDHARENPSMQDTIFNESRCLDC